MFTAQHITAVLLFPSSVFSYEWSNKVYVGPPPASLSQFFATQSAYPAYSQPYSTYLQPNPTYSQPNPAYSQQSSYDGGLPPTTTDAIGRESTTALAPNPVSYSNTEPTGNSPSTAATPSGTSTPSSSGSNCITFTSDDPSWSYSNSAPWTGSGTFGELPGGQICFAGASAGGAMYIGSSSNPGAGNTKFECYFPVDGGQGNCDVSLVDGYSLSVTCTIEGASQPTIGGSVDLYTSGTCPGGNQNGICGNTKAYDAAQSDVDAFFQPGIQSPNNYCIWWACTQDSFFNVGADISCHVSAGTPAAKNKRGLAVQKSRVHARSLE